MANDTGAFTYWKDGSIKGTTQTINDGGSFKYFNGGTLNNNTIYPQVAGTTYVKDIICGFIPFSR